MKVNEIVREERLDEVVPLIAGLGAIPMIFSAVMAGLKAYSIYELYDVLSRNGYDIDNMSDDDKLTLFFTLIGLFVPGGGKFTNDMLMRFMPAWVKRRGIKMVGDHLKTKAVELRKMKNANRRKYASTSATSPRQAAKNQKTLAKKNKKLDSEYQAIGRQLAAEKLKDKAYTLVGGLAVLPLAYTYYGKLDELDKQYAAHKSGDRATELFGNMDDATAWKEYQNLRNKYIGELTVGVTAALSRTPVTKLIDGFGTLVGKVPMVGGIVKLGTRLATRLARVGGPALAVLMQTDEGQKFLSNSIVEVITRGVGSLSAGTLNLLALGIDKALGAAGIKSNVQGAVQGQAPSPNAGVQTTSELEKKYNKPGTPRELYVSFDPRNPKIISVGGIKITGADGFLSPGVENHLNEIEKLAKTLNHPNPLPALNLKFK